MTEEPAARVTRTELPDGGMGWRVGPLDSPARRIVLTAVLVLGLIAIVVILATGVTAIVVVVPIVVVAGIGQPLLRGIVLHEEIRVRPDGLRIIRRVQLPGRMAGSPEGLLLRPAQIESVQTVGPSLKRLVGLGSGTIAVRRRRTGSERRQDHRQAQDRRDRERDEHLDRQQRRAQERQVHEQDRSSRTAHFGHGLPATEAEAIATRIRETLRA